MLLRNEEKISRKGLRPLANLRAVLETVALLAPLSLVMEILRQSSCTPWSKDELPCFGQSRMLKPLLGSIQGEGVGSRPAIIVNYFHIGL